RPDEDIFEVIERMRNSYVCLVVDDKRLINIITDFDTSEYFRRRAENIMLVEDIEGTIKDFIIFAYPRTSDGSENTDLAEAVQQALAPPQGFNQFKKAIAHYLRSAGSEDTKINPKHAENAYEVFASINTDTKSFEDLSMAEYISLLLN